jgi:hypothetical protein
MTLKSTTRSVERIFGAPSNREHSVVSEIEQILVRSPSISHATASAANAPEFADFFAHAVGNYLIGVAFSGTPDREEVLRHEAELEKPTGCGGFFAAMAHCPAPQRPDLRQDPSTPPGPSGDRVRPP